MENNDKTYFLPGDIVRLRLDIPNRPIMLVVKKETQRITSTEDRKEQFLGIRCRWFSTDHKLQEAVWNTKDLIKV